MLEYLMKGLFALIVFGLAALIFYGIYYLVETVGREEKETNGVVTYKHFEPEHFIYVYNAATKTSMPQVIPDSWRMNVEIHYEEELDGMEVSEKLYNSLELNDQVVATYRVGRISNNKYLFGITALKLKL